MKRRTWDSTPQQRKRQAIALQAQGKTRYQIARVLRVSVRTVQEYLKGK